MAILFRRLGFRAISGTGIFNNNVPWEAASRVWVLGYKDADGEELATT